MEFRETLLAAQRNQQQQSSSNYYYKAKFDPPKKEQKQKDRLSANIQKFLAKKDEEEKQKKLEAQRKREELLAMRDPKALRKIQKTLKVIKSANKSVIADAVDRDNTAVTREGPEQPDQDDYGYESQAAAAIYEKMMQQYSKIPEEPKFPTSKNVVKKDLKGTMERVKHALQHEDDPVPHKRRRKGGTNNERDDSPPTKYEPEKEMKKEEQSKSDRPKIRKQAPPPLDFNQLLKLAEQKKSEPLDAIAKKTHAEQETERLMTKKQKREYEEEMARRQRRQERLEAEKGNSKKVIKEDKPSEREKKQEPGVFGRIPKIGNKNLPNLRKDSPNLLDKERYRNDRERDEQDRYVGEKCREKYGTEREKYNNDKYSGARDKINNDRDRLQNEKERIRLEKEKERQRLDKERLDKLKAERERIDRDIDRLNRDREKLDKTKSKIETNLQIEKSNKFAERSKIVSREQFGKLDLKKSIDLKSQNTYRIDKNSNEKKLSVPNKNTNVKYLNGDNSQIKLTLKANKEQIVQRNGIKDKEMLIKQKSLPLNASPKTLSSKKSSESGKTMLPKRSDDKPSQSQSEAGTSKHKIASFDFDKHINTIGKNGKQDACRKSDFRRKANPDDTKRKPKRRLDSDSEYDSEMDDFIDDGDENMDYSRHIKEIFGYDKSKYRDMDDQDDPTMESSFARQQREEYISKKIGIMEDLEDMRMEAMEKKKSKKKRRISDD
ncbi:unnamed protein product [Diatraea saccharalis]|uniref:Protein SPT2 homolog n=1 Tax=Diatraea saccharalis TaxID=40085 RepID=A0A9N9R9D1_9NEOP|nr:unnamed protein product [Diatraea saccharalis]